ncbi:nuclear receptor co-repressor related ncor [Anaeramoeba ignava]|uniref:Nuclear receptor co-repressor related ncor n=1 Tax=Anaeramoeba ignava TaxID=1746090 RepID=A0A9Q0LK84_ANAIG|nr:nuclear receptor co-repressor related ncor [Anaeramoeba ignava]
MNWTKEEEDIFMEKILIYYKNFSKIASFLPEKTSKDVVAYYYLNKKKLNLKEKVKSKAPYLLKAKTKITQEGPPHPQQRKKIPEDEKEIKPKKSRKRNLHDQN